MQLTVTPERLAAAAALLDRCAVRIEAGAEEFRMAAARDVPAVGPKALGAAGESARAAIDGTRVIAADLRTFGRALQALANAYAAFDRGLVGRPDAGP